MSTLRLYLCAIVFAAWAVVRAWGVDEPWTTVAFLTAVAVSLVVAERERSRRRADGP